MRTNKLTLIKKLRTVEESEILSAAHLKLDSAKNIEKIRQEEQKSPKKLTLHSGGRLENPSLKLKYLVG